MGYLNRKMCFAKLLPVPPLPLRLEPADDESIFIEGHEALIKSLGKRKAEETLDTDAGGKQAKDDPPVVAWTWTDEGIYFIAPIQTPLKFTPLLPNATVKIYFDIQVRQLSHDVPRQDLIPLLVQGTKFYFLSEAEKPDLHFSFEQLMLLVPMYTLEALLYAALTNKLQEEPLKFYFKRKDNVIDTIPVRMMQGGAR